MSLQELQSLIAEARGLANDHPCQTAGHLWGSDGSRGCPRGHDDNCGQAVYVCERCGETDYGEKGGPGWRDCQDAPFSAPCREQCVAGKILAVCTCSACMADDDALETA